MHYQMVSIFYIILQKIETDIKNFIRPRFKKKKTQQLTIVDAFI